MKTDESYFNPWISNEEPKLPEGWGLDTIHRYDSHLFCDNCNKELQIREQYVYRFTTEGSVIYHNTKECCASIIN